MEFFQGDTPHGLVKRIMYKKYLQAFIPSTQQFKPVFGKPFTTVIIDGFAGAGRYDSSWPTEIERYGSPLIALMVTLNFYRKIHGRDKIPIIDQTDRGIEAMDIAETSIQLEPKVYLYFIESNPECFRNLIRNVTEALDRLLPDANYIHPHYPMFCTLINTEFANFQPPSEISDPSTTCLVYLDPFGYSKFPLSSVEKYVGPGNSLLLIFMSSFVNRFLGDERKKEVIKDLYGIDYLRGKMRDPQHDITLNMYLKNLLRTYQSGERPLNNIESCAANYEESLKTVLRCEYSLTFEMRGENNCINYHMIFITNHMKSLKIMKESMNRCSQEEDTLSMSDYLYYRNGCMLNLANTQDIGVVAEAIYDKFKGRYKIKISEVKDYVLLHTPYVFRKKPLKLMVKEENPRIIQVLDSDSCQPIRKGTFPDNREWFLRFRE